MACQVWNSCFFFLLLATFEMGSVSALAPRRTSNFMKQKIFRKLEKRVFSSAEKQKFVPYHTERTELSTLQSQEESCSSGPKTGFWFVGCYMDKDPDNLRMKYEGEAKMTPEVCFQYCKYHRQMRFFFLKLGRECTCARHYHKGSKGGLGSCTDPCEGDGTKYCGGVEKESVYEMHDCDAVAYKPTDPNEAFDAATEITDKGVKFFFSGRDLAVRGTALNTTDITTVAGGLKKGLSFVVINPRTGTVKAERTFLLDGWNPSSNDYDTNSAHAEEGALRSWVNSQTLLNDVVMVGADPKAFDHLWLQWGADAEQALIQLGCPAWQKPTKGMGFAAVCSGHADGGFSSATVVDGHIAVYGPQGTMADTRVYYTIDCEVSAFTNEGSCSVSCGSGLQLQTRHVTVSPAHGGLICPEGYERHVACNTDPCPIDCGYSQWTGWGPCDQGCGPGFEHKTRSILNDAQYGGVVCDRDDSNVHQTKACEIVPCPIHAVWGAWSDWTPCSEFCGPGDQARGRTRAVIAQYGGNDVSGPLNEQRGCEIKPCPIDCEITEWANEGGCSLSCAGGKQKQTREIVTHAAHGGAECPTDLVQHLDCNEQPCPIDCVMSDFQNDGDCSLTCGTGQQLQFRYTKVHPDHGGAACPADFEQYIDCNTEPCPIDCVLEQWVGWSACDKSCGPGKTERTRGEAVVAQHGGRACVGSKKQTDDCEIQPCAIDCEWDEWVAWTECDETCGPGRHARTRIVAVHAQWGGAACEGASFEEEDCEITPCAVDCEMSDWADAGVCDKDCGGGKLRQTREVATAAQHGGECPTDTERHVDCNPQPCPVECELMNWFDTGDCSVTCGGGIMQQARYVITHAQHGAEPCPSDMDREIACNEQLCPIDGVWSPWSGYSACSTVCGPGISIRTRSVMTEAQHGGKPTEGVDYEDKNCQTRECPIDCEWGDWTAWGACSDTCGPGVHYKTREVAVEPMYGGEGCAGNGQEEQACEDVPCPIDCELTNWMEDGECDVTCGGGFQNFKREVATSAAHGGAACPTDLTKQESCNTWSCPVDCVVSDWITDGGCSVSCGGGLQAEVKIVETAPAYGGGLCPTTMTRHVACSTDPCPIDCEHDAWSGWTVCSASCGNGTSSRSRGQLTQAEHGGAECEGKSTQNRDCEIVPCAIDCVFDDWSDWSVCDEPCGPGSQERSRGIATHPMYGGAACEGKDLERQDCTGGNPPVECPVDCVITEWGAISTCSRECGGGTLEEERVIEVNSEHGGESCPTELTRSVPCNEDPCPVDCVLSAWTSDGTCSQTCGGGVIREIKTVLVQTAYGGEECDSEQERWSECNAEACPIDCVWNLWNGWSPCSAPCGDGETSRSRDVRVHAANGGVPCSGDATETNACIAGPCPIDGVWGDWTEFGECSEWCGEGLAYSSRVPLTSPAYGGAPLEGLGNREEECTVKACPVDCEVGDWKPVENQECTVTCGGGLKKEKRDILTAAAHEGEECPSDLERDVPCSEDPCPVDCVVTEWAEVAGCTVTCGGGTKKFQRHIETPTSNGGASCEVPLERDDACNEEACPVDCLWGEWTGYGECTTSCGPGEQERVRSVEIDAANGGAACTGQDTEKRDCELMSCPIEGVWGDWSDWTECNEHCGPGESKRSRAILTPPQFGGEHPTGPYTEVEECEIEPCPVDCKMTEWAPEGDCSVSCNGGLQVEKRTVETDVAFGGDECPTDTVREVACGEDPCPIDCVLSDWKDDSTCSVSCGGGSLSQIRTVDVSPANGGEACSETLQQDVECSTAPCPIDCVWGEWAGWPACTVTCDVGSKTRSREISVHAAHGGEECVGDSEQTEPCNDGPCPVDCVYAAWGSWDLCTEECGGGKRERERGYETREANGGEACQGLPKELEDCNTHPCPVDCVMTTWENDGDCSEDCGGGQQRQTRTVETAQVGTGAACPAAHEFIQGARGVKWTNNKFRKNEQERHVTCNNNPCPVDCVLSDWTEDGSCSKSCGGGEQKFRKSVETAGAHGGAECAAADSADRMKLEACNEEACPVDCVMSEWTGYGACSTTCELGEQKRTREVTTAAEHGGEACPTDLEETQNCNLANCPIDCVLGEWEEWSACNSQCGPGTQTRERTVATEAMFGGEACSGVTEDTQDCEDAPCPVDCVLGEWENDGDCTTSCGGGEQKQKRSVDVEAAHGGEDCDAERQQTVTCSADPCPVDCVLGDWVESSECTVSCGEGTQTFIKPVTTAASNGGAECPDAEGEQRKKSESCNPDPCPVDCVLTAFGDWGDCSVTCADGTRSKSRSIETEAANGGAECDGDLTVEESCHAGHCPVDCATSDWAEWADCSVSCGESGTQDRTRTISTDVAHGGTACPALTETRDTCPDLVPCPVNCVLDTWGDYGDCSVTCGEGTKTKTRAVLTDAAHNGEACGNTEQSVACGEVYCPVDCVVSDWTASGTCSVVCGGGVQKYTRRVEAQAIGAGAACPTDLEKEENCNEHACPWGPVGEAGSQAIAMNVERSTVAVTLNAEFATTPVVITGPVPTRGGSALAASSIAKVCRGVGCGSSALIKMAFNVTKKSTKAVDFVELGEHKSKKLDLVETESKAMKVKRALMERTMDKGKTATQLDTALTGKGNSWHEPAPAPPPTPPPTTPPTPPPTPVVEPEMATPAPSPVMPMEPAVPLTGTFDEKDPSATPTGKLPACKCTGGPSNTIQFGEGNTQYPTEYGKFCSSWAPRDSSAAEAQAAGDPELIYLGDLWGYNSVTKMRVYLGAQVNAADQTIGENVVLPAGVTIPDFEGEEGVVWPTSDTPWCYVESGCNGAMSDGWATWQACSGWLCEERGNCAWDDRPEVAYPDAPEACPVAAYGGPKVQLTKLTRKANAAVNDICIGADGFNDCNDESGAAGGVAIGFVSNVMFTSNMVLLRRAYSESSTDTCIFPDGMMDTFCKGSNYGDATDLGWIFKKPILGTETLLGRWNNEYTTSCAMVKDVGDQNCWGPTFESLPDIGALLSPAAESAWANCGSGTTEQQQQWEITLAVDVEGSYTEADTEKIPWMAFQEGVYSTADGSMMQAGIAKVLAGNVTEVLTVPFHETFVGTPVVIAQAVGGLDIVVRQRDPSETELYLLISGADALDEMQPIAVHWMAFATTDAGYFGSVPFVAGEMDGSDATGDVKTWPDGEFSQIPLVFAATATDRTDGAVHVRTSNSTPDAVTFKQEGTSTLEKVSYFAYNGKGASGATISAVLDLEMTYAMVYTPWDDAACLHACDFSGAWKYGTNYGSEVTFETDANNPCTGTSSHWGYRVDVTATGTTVVLTDGTTGTVTGSPPEKRTISWSNGHKYQEKEGKSLGMVTRNAACKGTNGNEYPSIYCGMYIDTRTQMPCPAV